MGKKTSRNVFCPVCTTGREIHSVEVPRARIALTSLLLGGAGGAAAALYVSPSLGILGGVALASFYYVCREALWQERGKRDLECPVCHFDPVLYRRAPEQAKQRCLDSLKMREDTFVAKWQALKQVTPDKKRVSL